MTTERVLSKDKTAQWYKDKQIKYTNRGDSWEETTTISHRRKKNMQNNYNLFNNILSPEYIQKCTQHFTKLGSVPAEIINKDTSSGKIKVVLGMESDRVFKWKVANTSSGATTVREQEQLKKIKTSTENVVMGPIREQQMLEEAQLLKQEDLTEKEILQIKQEIQDKYEKMSPKEIKEYMQRDYQTPEEIMNTQLLKYFYAQEKLKVKFNRCFKHGLLSSEQLMFAGIINNNFVIKVMNPLNIEYGLHEDAYKHQESSWITCVHEVSPSEVIAWFGDKMSEDQIDKLYTDIDPYYRDANVLRHKKHSTGNKLRLEHTCWIGLRKIGELKYNYNGAVEKDIVNDEYKINKDKGDIEIAWKWVNCWHETWRLWDDELLDYGIIKGQFNDLNDIKNICPPYAGIIYDKENSLPTSLYDRLKIYQHPINMLHMKMDLKIAADKGVKHIWPIGLMPDKARMTTEEWKYLKDIDDDIFIDANQKGSTDKDISILGRQIDQTNTKEIFELMKIIEFLEMKQGASVGITRPVEGQMGKRDAVTNTQQAIIQSSHILSPYFDIQEEFKKDVLNLILRMSKVYFANNEEEIVRLSYIVDDMSMEMLKLDVGLLNSTTCGVFITNSSSLEELREHIIKLAHASLQNKEVDLSTVITMLERHTASEMRQLLKIAENEKKQENAEIRKEEGERKERLLQIADENAQKAHERKLEVVTTEETIKGDYGLLKVVAGGASYNPDIDSNQDGENDFLARADLMKKDLKLGLDKLKHEQQKIKDLKKSK